MKTQASSGNRPTKERGQKRPIQDLDLNIKNVTNVLKSVTKWYDLGLQLEVPVYHLEEIQSSYSWDGSRCKIEMLSYWFSNAEEQSWDVIADALEKINHRNLANEIRRGPSDDTSPPTVERTSTVAESVRPRKVHAEEQHHNGAPHAVPDGRLPRVPPPATHNKGCQRLCCLFVITAAVGLILWFGLLHDMPSVLSATSSSSPTSPTVHPSSPTRHSSSSSPDQQAPILNSDCHHVEAEHDVRDELHTVLDWKVLGQELRLPQEILVQIDNDYKNSEHKRRETIHRWFEYKEKPCWESVVGALKKMRENRLAYEIAERHGVKYDL